MQSRLILAFGLGAVTGLGGTLGSLHLREGWRGAQKQEERSEELAANAEQESDVLLFKYGVPKPPLSSHVYTSHTLAYDRTRRVPVWAAERLTKERVHSKEGNRKRSNFKPDPVVPPPFTSTNEDYWKSGWSRGHMIPAADCKHSQISMDDSFYLTNIVPQDIHNNAGYWNRLEMFCRDLTADYDEVRVISGPLFLPEEDKDSGKSFITYEVIGKNHVAVPTHLYKVVLAESGSRPTAMGVFVVPNKPLGDVDLTRFQVTLEELESQSGTTFHSRLDRSKVVDLCTSTTCKLMSLEKLAFIQYKRKMNSVGSQEALDKLWKEVETGQLRPDDLASLHQVYSIRQHELESRK